MKKYLISTLDSLLGRELSGLISRLRIYKRHYKSGRFGRFGIDEKLEKLLPHRDGYYVELGANDGAFQSNSYFFELKKGWKGVLVEPAPNLYLSCLKRRGENNHVFCNACVPFGYSEEFVRMKYSDAMTISDNLELDIGEHDAFIKSGHPHLQKGERTFLFGAKSATLTNLLVEASAPSLIDFLSLDVEGAELDVLKGVDFTKFNFKYMVIECRDIARLETFLSHHNYVLVEKMTHHDYLFRFITG